MFNNMMNGGMWVWPMLGTLVAVLYHRSTSGIKTSVTTKNGVVALTGIASNQAQIDLARKLASDVKGVQKVDNRMIIEK